MFSGRTEGVTLNVAQMLYSFDVPIACAYTHHDTGIITGEIDVRGSRPVGILETGGRCNAQGIVDKPYNGSKRISTLQYPLKEEYTPPRSPTAERSGGPEGGEMRPRIAVSSNPSAREEMDTLCLASHYT